jgi:phosphate transport system permease protein
MANSSNGSPATHKRSDGETFVWMTAAALAFTLLITFTLIGVVMVNGLSALWPADLTLVTLNDGDRVLGEITARELIPHEEGERIQIKTGNREVYGNDFRWIDMSEVASLEHPADAMRVERLEHGNLYGMLREIRGSQAAANAESIEAAYKTVRKTVEAGLRDLRDEKKQILSLSHKIQDADLRLKELQYHGAEPGDSGLERWQDRRAELSVDLSNVVDAQNAQLDELRQRQAVFLDAAGNEIEVAVMDIVRLCKPNAMSIPEKLGYFMGKLRELLMDEPRESNTEGGLFPAIFGTVMLIFLMSIFSFPLGVLAAIYLREYAKEGFLVRIIYIAVNNLAGIPSIVYGIFGLGFFVYGVGGSIDQLFFPERLPTPTFGTGGLLWASLTLAILTVPVVIVATDEALGAVPRGVREGSYALGATRLQTLVRVVLPMASPGIMTGFILAMARAAGEVAPLMITGVVKLAPALPVDGQFPYFHVDRKFMHLGFHIYDVGFQSPNVEAAKPMVYVTTLLLVLIVLCMSSVAIWLRGRMRRRYSVQAL